MTAQEILALLHEQGIKLQYEGNRLRYYPASAVSPHMLDELRKHKAEVIALLANSLVVAVNCEKCPTCDTDLEITEIERYCVSQCPLDPLHYYSSKNRRSGRPMGSGGYCESGHCIDCGATGPTYHGHCEQCWGLLGLVPTCPNHGLRFHWRALHSERWACGICLPPPEGERVAIYAEEGVAAAVR